MSTARIEVRLRPGNFELMVPRATRSAKQPGGRDEHVVSLRREPPGDPCVPRRQGFHVAQPRPAAESPFAANHRVVPKCGQGERS